MNERPKFIIFEKKETMFESIVSDLFTYSLAFLLMLSSWFIDNMVWTIVSVMIFVVGISSAACQSRTLKINSKQDAVEWANSLSEEQP